MENKKNNIWYYWINKNMLISLNIFPFTYVNEYKIYVNSPKKIISPFI